MNPALAVSHDVPVDQPDHRRTRERRTDAGPDKALERSSGKPVGVRALSREHADAGCDSRHSVGYARPVRDPLQRSADEPNVVCLGPGLSQLVRDERAVPALIALEFRAGGESADRVDSSPDPGEPAPARSRRDSAMETSVPSSSAPALTRKQTSTRRPGSDRRHHRTSTIASGRALGRG